MVNVLPVAQRLFPANNSSLTCASPRAWHFPIASARSTLCRSISLTLGFAVCVNLEIILRDFLVDILRGRAKNSRWLSWLRFPSSRAKVRFQLLRAHLEDGRSLAAIAREAKISYRTLARSCAWLKSFRKS